MPAKPLAIVSILLAVGCQTTTRTCDRITPEDGQPIQIEHVGDEHRWTAGDRQGYADVDAGPMQRTYTLLPTQQSTDVGSVFRFQMRPDTGAWEGTHHEITIAGPALTAARRSRSACRGEPLAFLAGRRKQRVRHHPNKA